MQVHGACANGASPRKRNLGDAHARNERTQNPETGAHARDHFVRRRCIDDVARRQMEGFAEMG